MHQFSLNPKEIPNLPQTNLLNVLVSAAEDEGDGVYYITLVMNNGRVSFPFREEWLDDTAFDIIRLNDATLPVLLDVKSLDDLGVIENRNTSEDIEPFFERLYSKIAVEDFGTDKKTYHDKIYFGLLEPIYDAARVKAFS